MTRAMTPGYKKASALSPQCLCGHGEGLRRDDVVGTQPLFENLRLDGAFEPMIAQHRIVVPKSG